MLQVYGPESSGKTTLALHAMAAVQRSGGTALLVDAEHAFDAQYSKVYHSPSQHHLPESPHNSECIVQTGHLTTQAGVFHPA